MAKFPIGSTVTYKGSNTFLKLHFSNGMKVIDVIPDRTPVGNGEINVSGQNLYRYKLLQG